MYHWLFLNEGVNSPEEQPRWKISALRIIFVSVLLLEVAIAVHSSLNAIAFRAYHVIVIIVLFHIILLSGLYYSARRPNLSAGILITTFYAAGATIVFFIKIDEIAKLGIVLVYATPICGGHAFSDSRLS